MWGLPGPLLPSSADGYLLPKSCLLPTFCRLYPISLTEVLPPQAPHPGLYPHWPARWHQSPFWFSGSGPVLCLRTVIASHFSLPQTSQGLPEHTGPRPLPGAQGLLQGLTRATFTDKSPAFSHLLPCVSHTKYPHCCISFSFDRPGKNERDSSVLKTGHLESPSLPTPTPDLLPSLQLQCHFCSLAPLATPSPPAPVGTNHSLWFSAVPWAFPCPRTVLPDGSGLFTLCLPPPMTGQAAGTGSDPPLCLHMAQHRLRRGTWEKLGAYYVPGSWEETGERAEGSHKVGVPWSTCHQKAFDRAEALLRATKGARESQERSPRVNTLLLFPGSPWTAQALGSVGPCPPEWIHSNEVY